jgi:hypothetical protein
MSWCPWIEDVARCLKVPGRQAWERPGGLGFSPLSSIFGVFAFEIKTRQKLMELVRNKYNMNGTLCKAQFIPEKLTVKMRNNGRQQEHNHWWCTVDSC